MEFFLEHVSLLKCDSYNTDNILTGIKKILDDQNIIIPTGKTVFIKTNLLAQNKPQQHTITHYTIIEALVKLLLAYKCEVSIGDSIAFYQKGLTKKAFETSGLKKLKTKYNITLIALDTVTLLKVKAENLKLKELYLPELLFKYDYIINACKLKSHSGLRLTGAIKNMFGILPGGYKQRIHTWSKNDFELSDVFLDLHDLIKPAFNIMDAIISLDGGPSALGKPVATGAILCSKNPAALDVIAAKMIGYQPEEIATLLRARERGIIDNFENIKVNFIANNLNKKFDSIPQFKFKNLVRGEFKEEIEPDLLVTATVVNPFIRKSICNKCLECLTYCKSNAITVGADNFPVINREKCINCYFCLSGCQSKAIGVRTTFMNKVIQLVRFIFRL